MPFFEINEKVVWSQRQLSVHEQKVVKKFTKYPATRSFEDWFRVNFCEFLEYLHLVIILLAIVAANIVVGYMFLGGWMTLVLALLACACAVLFVRHCVLKEEYVYLLPSLEFNKNIFGKNASGQLIELINTVTAANLLQTDLAGASELFEAYMSESNEVIAQGKRAKVLLDELLTYFMTSATIH